MISPIGHGPIFARKQPLRGPHAGREPLTNLLGAAWTSSESRMHVQRCDVATTSPSPTPRRLRPTRHGRQERRSGQARVATRPWRCTVARWPSGLHSYHGDRERSAIEQRAFLDHPHAVGSVPRSSGGAQGRGRASANTSALYRRKVPRRPAGGVGMQGARAAGCLPLEQRDGCPPTPVGFEVCGMSERGFLRL